MGYQKDELKKIVEQVKAKFEGTEDEREENTGENQGIVTLPWIPKVSPRLRKVYKKAGIKVVFKSGANLKTILTAKNKTKLPKNSHPGVYRIPCSGHPDKNPYIGETKLKIDTRVKQHYDDVILGKVKPSGVIVHAKDCANVIDWDNATTLKREDRWFPRKVREALEIQYHNSEPENGGMNLDNGPYVKTKFWKPMFEFLQKRSGQHYLTSNNG